MSEIELNKKTKEEKLIIANTLIDSVASEIENNTIKRLLNDCIVTITDCIDYFKLQSISRIIDELLKGE